LAHAVVANGEAVRQRLIDEGVPERKIVTIHNGLDLVRMAPDVGVSRQEILTQLGVPCGEDRRFVSMVANLHHEGKDHPTFLRAARIVHTAMPGTAFLIAGEGRLTGAMRSLAAELGIGDSVFFLGDCQRIPDLLFVSDVCVLSSKSEGFSNAILEYMAASRPVVATDVGGAREAVTDGETGFLVAPGDIDGMAARIVHLLGHPAEAADMGERGRRKVEARFSCAAQLRNTLGLYDALLAGRGLAPERAPSTKK
jgi:glycosyltransferase involved in cell wall biosynthesis